MSAPTSDLVGKFFLTFDDQGKLRHHGEILGSPGQGHYLCQLFSAWTGEPTLRKLVPITEMVGWEFYVDEDDCDRAHDQHSLSSRK